MWRKDTLQYLTCARNKWLFLLFIYVKKQILGQPDFQPSSNTKCWAQNWNHFTKVWVLAVCADVDHNNSNLLLNLGTPAKAISAYQSLFLYIFSIRQSSAAQICGQCANMCEATAKKYPRSYETQSFWGQLRNSLECAHILGVAKQAVDGEFITSLGRIHYSLIYIIYIVIDYLFI